MVTTTPDGLTRFTVFAPHARSVELAGTFTGWQSAPIAMTPGPDGWWAAEVAITPGDHEFQYRLDGWEWRPDYAAHGVRLNRLGAWVSGLYVAPSAAPLPMVRTRKAAALANAA